MDARVPLSHSLWSPFDTVKDAADSLGINLPDEAAKNLAMDVEYRIHEILELSIKFMRHSKRKLLTTSDISQALKVLNVEPLFGYDNFQPVNFKETMVGAGGQTLYYIDDHEIEFEKLINQELPKIPRQTTFTAHWLAIEGVQPMVPQNPLPQDIKNLPPIMRGATSSILGNDILSIASNSNTSDDKKNDDKNGESKKKITDKDLQIKPLVKHVLSKELKLYFDKVVEVLISQDPEKEQLKNAALTSLKNDPGLHQLVPYFIQFVAEQITNQLRNINILMTMLEVISALVDNKTIFLDPYVHALMPCILTLLLAKRIGPIIKDTELEENQQLLESQLSVREFAAIMLEHIIKIYGNSYSTLRPRVTRTLLKALLDSTKPIGTHYGALLGLKNMGNEVVKLVVIGNLKIWFKTIIDSNENEFENKILIDTILDILRKLKVEIKSKDGENEDNMDIDSDTNILDDIKEKLIERVGDNLSKIILEQEDAKDIVRGLFFGELSV